MFSKTSKQLVGMSLVIAAMSYAGAAAANPSATSFSAQATPTLSLPLGILDVTVSGPGLDVSANLFPKAPYTPILNASLLKGSVNATAFIGTPAVPEPESIVMMGVGLALVSMVVRRRRNKIS